MEFGTFSKQAHNEEYFQQGGREGGWQGYGASGLYAIDYRRQRWEQGRGSILPVLSWIYGFTALPLPPPPMSTVYHI